MVVGKALLESDSVGLRFGAVAWMAVGGGLLTSGSLGVISGGVALMVVGKGLLECSAGRLPLYVFCDLV